MFPPPKERTTAGQKDSYHLLGEYVYLLVEDYFLNQKADCQIDNTHDESEISKLLKMH